MSGLLALLNEFCRELCRDRNLNRFDRCFIACKGCLGKYLNKLLGELRRLSSAGDPVERARALCSKLSELGRCVEGSG